jgi:replicative DNA helicase
MSRPQTNPDPQITRLENVPHSVEAEQQVLGEMLLKNCEGPVYPTTLAHGGAELFYDPVHRRIFEVCNAKALQGFLVSPISVAEIMREDAGLSELGGPRYLIKIAGAAMSGGQQYVTMLADLKRKRDLIHLMHGALAAIARGDDDADMITSRIEASLISAAPVGMSRPTSMAKALEGATKLIAAADQGSEDGRLRTGISAVDSIVPGFYPGELILLGGRPSMGKSAVAMCIATRAARAGKGVCIATLEMTPEAMAMRMVAEATAERGRGVSYAAMRKGDLTEAQMRAVLEAAQEDVGRMPIEFLPSSYRDIGAIFAGVKQVQRRLGGNLGLVIVDYLGLIKGEGKSRYEAITNVSIALKGLALQLNVPVLALSQLSRAVEDREDKHPHLSDLRESGQLEQDADTVMFCFREEYYLEREQPDVDDVELWAKWDQARQRVNNRLEIIVAKQRQGETGTAHMMFNPATNMIWDDNARPAT